MGDPLERTSGADEIKARMGREPKPVMDLKPCPFCGGEAAADYLGVGCANRKCFVSARADNNKYDSLTTTQRWNTRPAPDLIRTDNSAAIVGLEATIANLKAACKEQREYLSTSVPRSRIEAMEKEITAEKEKGLRQAVIFRDEYTKLEQDKAILTASNATLRRQVEAGDRLAEAVTNLNGFTGVLEFPGNDEAGQSIIMCNEALAAYRATKENSHGG